MGVYFSCLKLFKPMKPPHSSIPAMCAYIAHHQQMNESTNFYEWKKQKESLNDLKMTIIKVLRWELSEDYGKLFEDGL